MRAGAVLYAKDVLQIAGFYSDVLGLQIKDSTGNFVKLESDGFQLVVLQTPERITNTLGESGPSLRRENTAIKLVFFVESINQSRAMAKKLSGDVDSEWVFEGYQVCDGSDPEGNIFQLRSI